MIDYTKIYLLNIDIQKLRNNNVLDFKTELSKSTGEIGESLLVAKYHFCKITIKTTRTENEVNKSHVIFSGSIHKMFNSLNGIVAPNYNPNIPYKGYNGNKFTINNIIEMRKHLENLFDCNACQMVFKNIEFGVNTKILFNPTLFLKGLLYHKNQLFEYSHFGNYAQSIHQWFIFKIYNKSYQYKMPGNVLRIELKIIKMIQLKRLGIKTFADINQETLQKASMLLLNRFDEVMYYDYSIDKNILSKPKLRQLENYSNPRFWIEDLKPIHRDRHKKNLKSITVQYSENLHQQIRTDIAKKCVMINQLYQNPNCVIINHSSIGIITTQKPDSKSIKNIQDFQADKTTICKVTGKDISMQKQSILLSHSGLKYIYKNDIVTFEQIKNKYLSNQWNNSNFQTQIKEIAHNIRNTSNNQKTKQQRMYNPIQLNILASLGI